MHNACENCEVLISKTTSTTERKSILRLKYALHIDIRVDHKIFVILSYLWFNDLFVMTPKILLYYFDFFGYFPRSALVDLQFSFMVFWVFVQSMYRSVYSTGKHIYCIN